MSIRQNMTYIIIGRQGTGKSDSTKSIIQKILSKNDSITKLVVFDEFDSDIWVNLETWDHPEWKNDVVSVIPIDKLLKLKSGKVRICQETDDIKMYLSTFKQLNNSIIVFEDATRYFPSETAPPKELLSILLNAKQRNNEVILIFHSLMDVPKKLVRNIRIIILHHTDDGEVPKKFGNKSIHTAYGLLKKSKNPFQKIAIPINVNTITTTS